MTIIVKLILLPITYWQGKFIAIMKIIRYDIEELNEELNEKLKYADPLQKQQATIDIDQQFYKYIKSFLWADDLTSSDSVFHYTY